MVSFEVGVVYRRGSRYFLAVTDRVLITVRDGEVLEVRPYAPYEPLYSLPVEELCERWGLDLDALDGITARYLAPDPGGLRARLERGHGRRRSARVEEAFWHSLRRARLLAG